MKAIVYQDTDKVAVSEIPKPQLQHPEDAIIKVTLAAICGTDIHMIHGAAPMMPGEVLGHEFVGVIEELGERVEGFEVGDRVAVTCTAQCGRCDNCKKGLPAKCRNGGIFGCGQMAGGLAGAQAEFVRVPYANSALYKIPDTVTDQQALLVGDILSTGYFAVTEGNVQPGDAVAIFGAGPVGLAATACAKLFSPSRLIMVGRRKNRLDAAKKLGATHVIDPTETDPVAGVQNLTGGAPTDLLAAFRNLSGADVVIEAVGTKSSFDACFQAVRPGGSVAIVGVYEEPQDLPMPSLCVKNIRVSMGLVNVVNMARLLRIIEAGMLDATAMITHELPLKEGVHAYDVVQQRLDNAIKVALRP